MLCVISSGNRRHDSALSYTNKNWEQLDGITAGKKQCGQKESTAHEFFNLKNSCI